MQRSQTDVGDYMSNQENRFRRHAVAAILLSVAFPDKLHCRDYYRERQEVATAALPYAILSEAVYSDVVPGDRWQVLNQKSDSKTGLKAATYGDSTSGKIVIAFAGTNILDWHDRAADADNYFRGKQQELPDQYKQALEYVQQQAKECHCEPVVTGHSLGGGLAAYSAAALGLEAWTFNPAGLGKSTYKDTKDASRITNLMDLRDPVHAIDKGKTKNPGRKWQFDFKSDGKGFERLLDKHKMSSFKERLEQVSKGLRTPYREYESKSQDTTGFGKALKKAKESLKPPGAAEKSRGRLPNNSGTGTEAEGTWRKQCVGSKCYSIGPSQ
jgi:hypothetical protein